MVVANESEKWETINDISTITMTWTYNDNGHKVEHANLATVGTGPC